MRPVVYLAGAICLIGLIWWFISGDFTVGEQVRVRGERSSPPNDSKPHSGSAARAEKTARSQTRNKLEPPSSRRVGGSVRILSGTVSEETGRSFLRGTLMGRYPLNNIKKAKGSDYIQELPGDGSFRYELPKSDFPGAYVAVEVIDKTGFLFRGKVRIGRDVVILVRSSNDPRWYISGHVQIDDPRISRWMARIHSVGRPEAIADLFGDLERGYVVVEGPRSKVTFRLRSNRYFEYSGEVALTVFDFRSNRSVHAVSYREFASMDALAHALRAGVTMVTRERTLRLPSEPRVDKVWLSPANKKAPDHGFAVPVDLKSGNASCHLLDRRYFVKGYVGNVVVRLGVVQLTPGAKEIDVRWTATVPGDHTQTIRVVDLLGRPLKGALVGYRQTKGVASGMHGGWSAAPAGDDGVARLTGLYDGEYRITLMMPGDSRSCVTKIPVPSETATLTFDLGSSVVVEPRFPVAGVNDYVGSMVYYYRRQNADDWRKIKHGELGFPVLRPVKPGLYEFAAVSAEWGGTCTREIDDVAGQRTVSVPVEMVQRIRGRVVTRGGHGIAGCTVRAKGQALLPGYEGVSEEGGRFQILMRGDGPWRLRVWREGTVDPVAELTSSAEGKLTIRIPE